MLSAVMLSFSWISKLALASAGLFVAGCFPAFALEKGGMPDLAQEEQTCLPTSTANLIVWFGTHGYPKLIVPGDSAIADNSEDCLRKSRREPLSTPSPARSFSGCSESFPGFVDIRQ